MQEEIHLLTFQHSSSEDVLCGKMPIVVCEIGDEEEENPFLFMVAHNK